MMLLPVALHILPGHISLIIKARQDHLQELATVKGRQQNRSGLEQTFLIMDFLLK